MQLLHARPVKRAVISAASSGDNTIVAAVDGKRLAHLTPANVQVGDIFTVTIGLNSVTFTATAGTVANVTDGLTTAWNASTWPEFTPFTATDATTHIAVKADAVNVDFAKTPVLAATNGGANDTQTLTLTDVAWAERAAQKILVLDYFIVANGTVTARWESGAGGTALSGQMDVVAQTELNPGFSPIGHFETAAGSLLNLELSGAVEVAGHLSYQEIP